MKISILTFVLCYRTVMTVSLCDVMLYFMNSCDVRTESWVDSRWSVTVTSVKMVEIVAICVGLRYG